MTIEDLVRGTFFEELFKFAEKDDLGDWGEVFRPIAEGEIPISELTPLERACAGFFDHKNEEAMDLINSGTSVMERKVQYALDLAFEAMNLFQLLLHERFENKPIEIRRGGKIIGLESGPCNCLACLVKRMNYEVVILDLSRLRGASEVLH